MVEVAPFATEHLDGAAALLAARHHIDRTRVPALPARFEEAPAARAAIEALLVERHARGVVALRGGRVVGYLLGRPLLTPPWPRGVWIDPIGHAADASDAHDIYRELYAAFAPSWVANGCFGHVIVVPAQDRVALNSWWSLGFGQQQTYALREITEADTAAAARRLADAPSTVTIRRAAPEDAAEVVRIGRQLAVHQPRPPNFAITLPEAFEGLRRGHTEALSDPAVTYWVVERDGRLLAFQLFEEPEPEASDLLTPERCIELSIGITDERERGTGVGSTLLAQTLAWARDAGYGWCRLDWRTANLAAARFWLRHGARPVAYRLFRAIDERIAWARP